MAPKTPKKNRSATVRTSDVKPKRPKVDRGQEIEQLVRQIFKITVDLWCKENLEEQPDKDVRGNVVDNLTSCFTSAIETQVDAVTDLYLSTYGEDDEDDDEEEDEDDDGDDDDEEGDDAIDAEYEEED